MLVSEFCDCAHGGGFDVGGEPDELIWNEGPQWEHCTTCEGEDPNCPNCGGEGLFCSHCGRPPSPYGEDYEPGPDY